MSDQIVYGANCVWWDTIDNAGSLDLIRHPEQPPMPCCPKCKGMLFQMDSDEWWRGVEHRESEGWVHYKNFIEWLKGKCFPTFKDAKRKYKYSRLILNPDILKWLDAP